ncbi:MAG: TolC family protein [Alphaproteobacteria bacterium]|nr:TolC family protein [Alphaproteobacteria bacterium]NCQ88873.1 TolC family protein [Alphaproteobacteria bacterium]NCT07776.1 TolC family protein [Alphaproteobacteria bacterium]
MTYKSVITCLIGSFFLAGCITTEPRFEKPVQPHSWGTYQSDLIVRDDVRALGNWWESFDDPVLNQLINLSLSDSPQRRIAETRILEARGIRKTTASFLFPQIGASADSGRSADGFAGRAGDFYDARFDASYEVDLFGRNRKSTNAAEENIRNFEEQYRDVTLSLIAEMTRDYIDYRGFEKQVSIARNNLTIQEKTLDLIRYQKQFGEATQLDVERSENLVNTTRASIPEFIRLADAARLRLSVLTGQLPEVVTPILEAQKPIPKTVIEPVLLAPSQVITLRPDIRAAAANLRAATSLAEFETLDLFPKFTLAGFYGVAKGALFDSTSIWNIAAGTAVSLIDFGRIEGRIDAARAIERRAYEGYRLTILEAIAEVETALSDYAQLNEQYVHLLKAYDNANTALGLSETLYKEGEISFINVLDSQRTLSSADAALTDVEAEKSKSLVRLYKALGVY